MSHTYFLTGTDTDVGKTLVACSLLHAWQASGLAAVGYKPIAAGCERTAQGLRNRDALQLQAAGSVEIPYEAINPIAYAPPIAPHIAAEQCGIPIDTALLDAGLARLQTSGAERVLVEGAGGWHLPIGGGRLLSHWVAEHGLPVILVVGARLGCLNHALLTAEAIRAAGLTLAGWVCNRIDPEMPFYEHNRDTLAAMLGAPLLGEIPWLGIQPQAAPHTLDVRLLR